MIKEIADCIYRCKENPSNWRYEFDKFLQEYELLPPQDWSTINFCFITSTGRTGTKFLAKFLDNLDEIYSIHEPDPNFRKLSINYAKGKYSFNRAKNEIEINRRALCRKVKREESRMYVESNPRLFSLIKPLKEVFIEPYIIHIVRDGRDFVRSAMSRPYGAFYSKGDTKPRLKANDFPDDDYYDKWNDLSVFEKICWYWKKRDEIIYLDMKDYSNGLTIRFEDIFKRINDYQSVKEICDFLELEDEKAISIFKSMQENKINKTKQYSIPHWKEWDEGRKLKFNQIAGEHMKKYYDYK